MALSLTPMRTSPKKKKPTTLQAEQTAVAKPIALQPTKPQPTATKPPPSAPRETVAPAAPMPTKPTLTGDIKTPTAPQATAPAMTTFSNVPSAPNTSMGLAPKAPTTPSAPSGPLEVGNQDLNGNGIADWKEQRGDGTPRSGVGPAGPLPGAEQTLEAAADEGIIPQGDEQFDQQVRQLMGDLLAGRGMDVDTAEEEALIKQLMEDRLGQGLVEQRARMGRAGFGASGALAAMEGDVRRQAGQQAAQETLGLRRQAEQEAIDNALRAIGVDVEKRREGRQATFDQEFLDALKSAIDAESGAEQQGGQSPLDTAGKIIDEKGIIQGIPELAGMTFEAAVKAMYGKNADPAAYTLIPVPPFILPLVGGAEGPIGQAQSAITGFFGVK